MTARTATIDIRPATDADLEAEHRVFVRAEGDVSQAHGYPWSDPPFEWFQPIHRHLLAHDANRSFVAVVEGRVVGFTAAFARGETWFFSALFIDPEFQGRGIGKQLFDLAMGDPLPRRITITDSIQPISNALYARHGLIPTVPLLAFGGIPQTDAPGGLAQVPSTPGILRAIDLAAYGFDRAVDHEHWSATGAPTVWGRGSQAVAYAYSRPNGAIGPLAAIDETSAGNALQAELARRSGSEAFVEMPGTAREMVSVALQARLRIEPPPGLLLLSSTVEPPRALAISNYFLM